MSSASETASGTESGSTSDTTTTTTSASASDSASASVTQGSGSETGDSGTTTTTTTTTETSDATSDSGTTTTTTGETTGVDPTTSTTSTTGDTTGDTTGTTGDTTGDTDTDTDTGTTGNEVIPGSCRPSEAYGSAGAPPVFADPNFASFLDKQVAVVTSRNQSDSYLLHVFDISGAPPPPNINYAAPRYNHPSWTSATFGGFVYGVTIDSDGAIYVAATTVYGANAAPGRIIKVDPKTGEAATFAELPNSGPAFGNLNYDCYSESIYVTSHEDGRIYQLDKSGDVVSTYRHSTKDVSIGLANDAGEPNGQYTPLGDRVWGVQSHAGRLYYGVWWEDSGRPNANQNNEIWSVAYVDESGVPDPDTAQLEVTMTNELLSPVSDITFAASGRMIVGRRTMTGDNSSLAHQSDVLSYDYVAGAWELQPDVYNIGELANSAAGGVDHDFAADGYVWSTGDALDFYTPNVVYGIQGVPYAGGDISVSTLIDLNNEIVSQNKTAQGDVEIPIPDGVEPVPPPE
ncbi:MAG: hypothetical protein R3A79_08180 [Nannocystaceae bacterium]